MANYWISYNNSGPVDSTGESIGSSYAICVDSTTGDSYTASQTAFTTTSSVIYKCATDGTLNYAVSSRYTLPILPRAITISANGSIILTGATRVIAASTYDFWVAKYDPTTGTLLGSRRITAASSNSTDIVGGVVTDSSDNIYCAGYSSPSGTNKATLFQTDSTGVCQYMVRIYESGAASAFNAIAKSSSDYLYAVGYFDVTAQRGLLVKYDLSGAVQWERQFYVSTSSYNLQLFGVDVDNTNTVVGFGGYKQNGNGAYYAGVYGICNYAGTLQASGKITASSTDVYGRGLTFDSEGNYYVYGYYLNTSLSHNAGFIIKFNSAGVVQWKRQIDSIETSADTTIFSLRFDANNNIYISGNFAVDSGSITTALTAKLPSDGTGTGTYGSFTYSDATALSVGTESFTFNSRGLIYDTDSFNTTNAIPYTQKFYDLEVQP